MLFGDYDVKKVRFYQLVQASKTNKEAFDEVGELIKQAQNGNEELQLEIIKSFLPLVKRFASHYEKISSSAFDFDDLMDIGTLGIINAINKYDHSKQCIFSKLAYNEILGVITTNVKKEIKNNNTKPLSITNDNIDNKTEMNQYLISESVLQSDYDTFETVNKQLNNQKLYVAIRRLKPQEQSIIKDQYIYGLTQKQMCEKYDLSYSTLNFRCYSARQHLKSLLGNSVRL